MKHFSFSKLFPILLVLILACAAFLRLYALGSIPSSLYWEEAALGYDAYSIAQTGKDHHGNSYPLIAFPSFGDYKPSGYFYAIVPFIQLIGLNETAVRLPSALAGIATVFGIGCLVYIIAQKIWLKQTHTFYRTALLIGSSVATFSPWLIQFSRGGWEVNLATSLLLWAVIAGLSVSEDGRHRYLQMTASVILSALSMYVYHATRVIAPTVLLSVFLLWEFSTIQKNKFQVSAIFAAFKKVLLPGVFFIVLIAPLLISSRDKSTQQRFAETSLTSDGQYVTDSNAYRAIAGDSIVSKVFTHRYVVLGKEITTAFLSHFSPDFLFVSGDTNPRHSTGFAGILQLPDAVWLFIGAVTLLTIFWKSRQSRPFILLLLWWLFVGILPAAITKAYPHALRILPTAPVFLTVVSIGILQAGTWLKSKSSATIFSSVSLFVGLGSLVLWGSYWMYYTRIYPVLSQPSWQYGYKEMVKDLHREMQAHPEQHVFVTREYGRPAMYYWFYSQTSPQEVQAEEATASKDQGEFLQFKNITFINTVNEAKPGIVASSPKGFDQLTAQFSSVKKLDEIRDGRGELVWIVSQVTR